MKTEIQTWGFRMRSAKTHRATLKAGTLFLALKMEAARHTAPRASGALDDALS